ncbi:penicillin-binding protein 1A [Rhodothermus profundi]|uniref:Penicillin-binding protein 1A n=1 Tax=Rhodothermus profundi TaxID=633813 RepID=A0A1M6RPH6_9BACT|nr:PBP1A family penicillin-binding protein [Rhodothermus profundi]SHK34382.1 penicillin-binding protein 1A [Rhodothermus profundi]
MPDRWTHTEEELQRYFNDPNFRHARLRSDGRPARKRRGLSGFFYRRFRDPRKAQAALVLSVLVGLALLGMLALGLYVWSLADELPSFQQLDNPTFELATVAYTADGRELARYARQNRTWVSYDEISPYVIQALLATEDHRFYDHWGIDLFRTASAVAQTILSLGREVQGGSTITQQLARNLYNEQIGRAQTIKRKLKEMVTAVELERRYTKREIIEMYLNTVEFVYNAFGIESAARTFFNKPARDLNVLEAATLVGMLRNPALYNPIRFPERARQRRNVVLWQMVRRGYLDRAFFEAHKDDPIVTDFHTSSITASIAPYFAEYVRRWLVNWAQAHGYNIYTDGLRVYTTLDSRLQELARQAVVEQLDKLQAVVNYEWSRETGYFLGDDINRYLRQQHYEPFAYYWSSKQDTVDQFIRETERYRRLVAQGIAPEEALRQLRADQRFMDSLKAVKTRLEAGFVAIDPRNGYVRAWVGGRDLTRDWYDHVAIARRQPGSTFKPFLYTAAIDNGWSPYDVLPDSSVTYVDPAGNVWQPKNAEGESTGQLITLREALARSVNTVSARLVLQVGPSNVAFYARRMGIKSPLKAVPSLALGTSNVTLLELVSAYATLASGGLYYEPTVVTRIEDANGHVLYEARPTPREAISEETAYTVVDMLRDVIRYGTGQRIRWQFGLTRYDLAGKTGTTQNSADGWFVLMHPELVTGAWVGFNDPRVTFRTHWWGQGAHNALLIVGDFWRRMEQAPDIEISDATFPLPLGLHLPGADSLQQERRIIPELHQRRVGW